MIRIRNGRVTGIGDRRPGATELRVELDDEAGEVGAISYDELTGPVEPGDRVVLNTTAVALGLGTGGFHVVMARLGGPVDAPGPGHVIKARYTPSQVRDGCFMVSEHNCAIARVAGAWPTACEHELALFRQLAGLDVEVERVAHIQAGDPVCAYVLRAAEQPVHRGAIHEPPGPPGG